MVSYTAFQLLAFAMRRHKGADTYSAVLHEAVLGPLNMTTSGLLNSDMKEIFAPKSLNLTKHGEPGYVI